MTALQGSLLDCAEEVEVGELAPGLERTELGLGAWVDLRRHWVSGFEFLFERLRDDVPWRAERRPMYDRIVEVPRLLAFYEEAAELPDPTLGTMRRALRRHYRGEEGGDLASVGLCCYRDGHDSVAWHGDRIGRGRRENVLVAILSLGAERAFLLRPSGGGPSRRYLLGAGDLLVMGGSCQRSFEHSVPKSARPLGCRVSVQFRTTGVR